VMMIIGSSLGYFFFAGLGTFALLFVKGHYHTSQATAELVLAVLVVGAAIGTVAGGHLSDISLNHGHRTARLWIPGTCYIGAALMMIPVFVASDLDNAVWFAVAGSALISAANPPLQAARLDVVPAGLWGLAASAFTLVRSLAQAAAPLIFGGISEIVAGIVPEQAPIGTRPHAPPSSATVGLQVTFLIMLGGLVAAGVFLFRARRTFASDVASAAASEQRAEPRDPVGPSVQADLPASA
jgi:Major Facilitator Superfamily